MEGSASAVKTIYVKLASTPPTQKAISLYNPDFSSVDSVTLEANYYDDVFLKSLLYNAQNKTVTTSQSNIINYKSQESEEDYQQDLKDYQVMLKSGNITRGLTLVNRYLKKWFYEIWFHRYYSN